MERQTTEEKLYHQHLFRLNDDLNTKLLNHMEEYGYSLSGIVRRSLQLFFDNGAIETVNSEDDSQKTMEME